MYIGAIPTPAATESRQEFTATANQTVFNTTGGTVGYCDCYLNGVKMANSDFSFDGADVTLTTGAAAGDVLAVVMRQADNALVALPITDSAGNNVLSESGGVVTLTADEANIGSNALVVDSSGDVGIGTSSPTQRLQVDGGAVRITGDYSAIASNQGLLLGFNSASDEARYYAVGANGGGVGEHIFISYNYSTSAGSERMRIDSSGNLLVGRTDNPSGASNCIYGAGNYGVTTGGGANVFINSEGLFFRSTSSRRYKNSIQDTTHGLAELLTLRPVTFKTNEDGDKIYGGLIAEEVHEAGLTEFVQYNDENQPDALDYGNMVSLCIKAIQEQQAIIESQQSQIDALTARIEALEATA